MKKDRAIIMVVHDVTNDQAAGIIRKAKRSLSNAERVTVAVEKRLEQQEDKNKVGGRRCG